MFIRAESVFRLILFQVKVSGENLFLLGANNSPSLKGPKKSCCAYAPEDSFSIQGPITFSDFVAKNF
jgi:hypothetical protein